MLANIIYALEAAQKEFKYDAKTCWPWMYIGMYILYFLAFVWILGFFFLKETKYILIAARFNLNSHHDFNYD